MLELHTTPAPKLCKQSILRWKITDFYMFGNLQKEKNLM